jgi:Ca2+/Na+ antiporter
MENLKFTCDRTFIEKFTVPEERSFMASLYCTYYFENVNFANLYLITFRGNVLLTLVCVIALVVLINISLKHMASRFLAPTISLFRRSMNWNPITTSFTLMALTNGIPSVIINAVGPVTANAQQNVGAIYGSFIFNVTIVCAVVIMTNPREVKMPRFAVIRELVAYLGSVALVVVFGLIGVISYTFVAIYFLAYIAYLMISIQTEELDKVEDNIEEFDFVANNEQMGLSKRDIQASALGGQSRGSQRVSKIGAGGIRASQLGASGLDFEINFDIKTDEDARKEDKALEEAFFTKKNMWKILTKDVLATSDDLLTTAIQTKVNLLCLLLFPSSKNPLMKSRIRPLLMGLALTFALIATGAIKLKLISAVFTFLLSSAGFYLLENSRLEPATLDLAHDFVALLSGVALTKIYVSLFCDVLKFFKFYYSVNDIIVSAIFLSAADSLGKLYINIALASQGELILAILSTYSVQTFQNFIGLSLLAFRRVNAGFIDFNLFQMSKFGSVLGSDKKLSREIVFFTTEIGLTVAIIIIVLIYYRMNRFNVKQNFPNVLILIYASFSVYSLFMGEK